MDRMPHYNLCVKMKDGNGKGKIGVAWKGKNGAINIKLNPGTYLDYALSQDAFINLFPAEYKNKPASQTNDQDFDSDLDSDAPF